ncbi:hypothetical protein DNTS_010235 [Danionella cerebrum]|uniref:Uncharacterized protein n=1 Tax=Danionella cerebrum TaxID=2873325 RepID=A0A553PEK8_9TELE|nr:hypothetical protein DNTS_010235 [Danionella translucida]
MHPIMIGIVTANTSMTVFYWNFLLSQVFAKKIKDGPEESEEVPTDNLIKILTMKRRRNHGKKKTETNEDQTLVKIPVRIYFNKV